MKKLITAIVTVFSVLLVIAATTTEVNISTLPHATSLASTSLVLVLTNATKARLATVQQILDLAGGGDQVWTNDNGVLKPIVPSGPVEILGRVAGGTNSFDLYTDETDQLFAFSASGQADRIHFEPTRADGNTPYILNTSILHTSGNLFEIRNADTLKFRIDYSGAIGAVFIAGTTNQVTFGGTNTAPMITTNAAKWISVQVSGFTNAYRIGLYE